MITESLSVPAEVSEQIQSVHAEVETLQRELHQALEVWHGALLGEKNQFDELLRHKESAWMEQEAEWQRQKQAYEQRIQDLQNEFDIRLKQTEQNAVRSLNELEDAWQRDKLTWTPAGAPAAETAPTTPDWIAEKQTLETRVLELETQLAQLSESPADPVGFSNELLNACLQALDHQIEVLYDLVQNHHDFANREPLS